MADPCGDATFAADVQPIFDRNCGGAACHQGTRPAGELSLAAGSSYAALVDVVSGCAGRLRVDPGNPDGSYLLAKVQSGSSICGSPMPLGGSLSAADVATLRSWICRGAPND